MIFLFCAPGNASIFVCMCSPSHNASSQRAAPSLDLAFDLALPNFSQILPGYDNALGSGTNSKHRHLDIRREVGWTLHPPADESLVCPLTETLEVRPSQSSLARHGSQGQGR